MKRDHFSNFFYLVIFYFIDKQSFQGIGSIYHLILLEMRKKITMYYNIKSI